MILSRINGHDFRHDRNIPIKDLFDEISRLHEGDPRCYNEYLTWERDVATPALEEKGWRVLRDWYTGDGDSFGPLVRCIKCERVDSYEKVIFTYG